MERFSKARMLYDLETRQEHLENTYGFTAEENNYYHCEGKCASVKVAYGKYMLILDLIEDIKNNDLHKPLACLSY